MITSHVLRIAAGNVALAFAGFGFLLLIDAWHRLGRWSRLAAALLSGQALFLTVAPMLLYAGLSVSPVVVLPLVAAVAVAGLLVARRRGPSSLSLRGGDRSGITALLGAALVSASLLVLSVRAALTPLYEIDTMSNWVMKAKIIWAGGERLTGVLDPRVFARPDLHPQSHLEYPLGMNALLAWSFHWMGAADVRVMHLQLVLLVAAAAGTSWALLRPITPDLPLAVGLAGLMMMPTVVNKLLTAYADVPLAFVWATGALALIRWAAEGERHLLWLATLMLAASLAIKQDGTMYVVAIYVAVGVPLVLRPRRPLRELLTSAGIVALTAVPWQLYTATHDLGRHDIRPGLGRMQGQADRLLPTLQEMLHVLTHPRTTLIAVPLAIALALVCIVRRRSTEAVPFLIAVAVVNVAILVIFWNSAVTLRIVLFPALGRILMGLIVLGWLLVPPLAFAAIASSDAYDETVSAGRRPRAVGASHHRRLESAQPRESAERRTWGRLSTAASAIVLRRWNR